MSRWVYQVVEIKPQFFKSNLSAADLQTELTKQGALGWELVQILHFNHLIPAKLVFKKEQ
ncbi:MAG: DUF4177 domain-containing protein [Pseudoxanthomonas sp.]